MKNYVKVPEELTKGIFNQRSLQLNGLSVIESCTHVYGNSGSMFIQDHLLLFVLQGTYKIRYGNQEYAVHKNEMVLLKRALQVDYYKTGDPENDNMFEYMMFFLKDDFLKDFIKIASVTIPKTDELVPISVKPINQRLQGFIESLKPYFDESEKQTIDAGLIKLKMLELLYDLASTDKNLMQQLLQLKQQVKTDIPKIVDEHILNPVSLSELAYLSGRSLSSFKRDFQAIYQVPPAQWIRERRLKKAKELLENSGMSVTDACYSTGFENVTHFSRLFKEYFGHSPSSLKV